jgi:formate hydrogenlyase subunit 3/multisubunit Na+/H+ antiporter MnhD subunit/formate hydrogenlyase subunit 4
MLWFDVLPLNVVIGVILAWIVLGVAGLFAPSHLRYVTRVLLPLGAVAAVLLAAAAFAAMTQDVATRVLPLGLPDLPFHLRLDALSAFFLALLGLASAGISMYYAGYLRAGENTSPGLTCLQYHLFLASMAAIMIADDGYLFMVAWETMALSSYFLVTSNHRDAATRSAGFLYLLIAHVGAIGILLCFGVLQSGGGDYTFETMRHVEPASAAWATVAYLLALFGFGAKAGVLPLHVWLPEAHPAAPSPVSALMSGVMLKTAIYGLLRVTFDLLNAQVWWWGVLTLALGILTALFGVLFAAVQTDMKRLLAYSSIENIGIVLIGIGLAITFRAFNMNALAALALVAALYHCLNHAFFKSLLFLVTGSVLHATNERSLGRLGGLIHRMPVVAWLALIGTLAIAGLPPLNGFVSDDAGIAEFLSQYAGAGRGRRAGVDLCLVGLRDGEILRRGVSGPAARRKTHRRARCGRLRTPRPAVAGGRVRAARRTPGYRHPTTGHGDDAIARRFDQRQRGCLGLVVHNADRARTRELQPADLPAGDRRGAVAGVLDGAHFLSRAGAPRRRLGLRFSAADGAHAGYGRRLRPADQADIRVVFPHRTACADAVRPHALLPEPYRRPPVVLVIPAGGAHGRARVGLDRRAAARPHPHLPDLQFCHADPVAGVCAMIETIFSQLFQTLLVVLLAPLMLGWINNCRAWLQNKSAPGLMQPYRTLRKLFHKDAVLAYNASPLFRVSPYLIFGCMVLAASIVPVVETNLPFAYVADAIALVGVFALARVFMALAAMDVGTAFGSLGARREMLVAFLAEPALLMVLFTPALISQSTSLNTMVETLAQREFAIYPSLAFAAVAFVMVLLAENARIPIDNPATHLELTMIHEAMILEYSARHLALVEWAAALKLMIYCTIGIALFAPWGIAASGNWPQLPLATFVLVAKLLVAGSGLALLETVSAKMRIFRAPEFLGMAFLLAVLGMLTHFLLER